MCQFRVVNFPHLEERKCCFLAISHNFHRSVDLQYMMIGMRHRMHKLQNVRVGSQRQKRLDSCFLRNISFQTVYIPTRTEKLWERFVTEWGMVRWLKMTTQCWHIRRRDFRTCVQTMAFITRTSCVQCTTGVNCGTNVCCRDHNADSSYAMWHITWVVTMMIALMHLKHCQAFDYAPDILCVAGGCEVRLLQNINIAAGLVTS